MDPTIASALRRLPELTEGADAIPLFGNSPPFDWRALSSNLAARFEIKDFNVQPSEQTWLDEKELEEELGDGCFSTQIFLHPLPSPLYFAIPKADKNKLAAAMMLGKTRSQISEPLKEGFCRFLVLEALAAAAALEPIARLTPSLGEKSRPSDEKAFCIDAEISFGETTCWAKLIFPASFRKSWIEHFSMHRPEYYSRPIAQATELVLGLECGSVLLTQTEWDEIEPGDFILLDRGSFNAEDKTSLAVLKVGTLPLFQAKVGADQMELIEYAFTNEEPMEQEQGALSPADEESVSIKDIPLNVSVELARLKITLDHLMHLNPGNMLPLPIHPDQGVVLTVNGKKVGRAELLYLGDSLGIRILELG